MRGIATVVLAALASACSFSPGAVATDAAGDAADSVTVGFAGSTTSADEGMALVQVRVILSKPVDEPITVAYAITGGTATDGSDFTAASSGTLTFEPQVVEQTIDIAVIPDGDEEPDETIELALSSVSGAGATLGIATNVVTISANLLPRVTFTQPTSNGAENSSPTIDVMLDKASPLTTSVDVQVMAGSATGGGVDYTFTTQTVTFAPNETTKQITLAVIDDALDEDAEDIALQLANPVNVVVGSASTHTHSISDNDNPPTVSFATATSSINEAGGFTDLVVSLSGASGKSITVPFAAANTSTATATTDYSFGTTSPLTFAPGDQQKTIRVNVVQDTAMESNETVVVTLGTLTNATAGTPASHTLTIVDDDTTCVGAGPTQVCFPAPSAAVTISGTLDTDNSSLCASTMPTSGWTGGPSSCFVVGTNVTIAATQVFGARALVVVASGDLHVTGNVDAASHRGGTTGPGASTQTCTGFTRAPTNSTSGAGGGAGATFRTRGGDGGIGNNVSGSNGTAPMPDAAPTVLRAGCTGQNGGNGVTSGGTNAGRGGRGGGAVYLAAVGTLTIDSGVVINVSGASAAAQTSPNGGFSAGGGGGGSGGMLLLQAATYSVTGAMVMANGGGGSSGGDANASGASGNDPDPANITAPAQGGPSMGAGGVGGDGFAGSTQATNGQDGSSNRGGGGGGGGGGYVKANAALTGASISAGQTAAP